MGIVYLKWFFEGKKDYWWKMMVVEDGGKGGCDWRVKCLYLGLYNEFWRNGIKYEEIWLNGKGGVD